MNDLASAIDTKTCPECAEDVREAARRCRYCGHAFNGPELASNAENDGDRSEAQAESTTRPDAAKRRPYGPWAGLLVATIAVGGLFAFGGYKFADASAARAAGEKVGYKRGYKAGSDDGYEASMGRATVLENRVRDARNEVRVKGYKRGFAAGGQSLFSGFDDWSIGRWYIVEIGSGSEGIPYKFPTRYGPMEYGDAYTLCASGDGICGGPIN